MGKIAGIGGLALGTLLILFRDVVRKNIFSNLTREQSYKLLRLIIVLVWSVAIIGIAAWLIAPAIAQPNHTAKKVVILMDSPLEAVVYDTENKNTGRTNADEIYNSLKDIKNITIDKETTNLQWNREEEVRSKNPDLIILHLSAFHSETQAHAGDRKLISFFEYVANTKSLFLVYTRSPFLEDDTGQQAWISQLERRIHSLKGRIQFFNFVPGKPKKFRDSDVQRELKIQVRNMLGIQ